MSEFCKEFIRIRKESKSIAEAMARESELKLFEKMNEDEIRYLHKAGYIPAMFCSCAIKALKERQGAGAAIHPHDDTVATKYAQ